MDVRDQMLDQYVSTKRLMARFKEQDPKMLREIDLIELYAFIQVELEKRGYFDRQVTNG